MAMRVGGQARLGWRATGSRAAVRDSKCPALSDTFQLLIIHHGPLALELVLADRDALALVVGRGLERGDLGVDQGHAVLSF